MFPEQNRSEAVVECLRRAALAAGVKIHCGSAVRQLSCSKAGGFQLVDQRSVLHHAQLVLLASGGHPSGRRLAQDLGHTIVPPVPSLFSLKLQAPALTACSGIALDDVGLDLSVGEQRFRQTGRVLITHRGVSGPAVLRLTAFAARALHASRYKGELRVDWSGGCQAV
jgi:predicted flavoprotein YhiN